MLSPPLSPEASKSGALRNVRAPVFSFIANKPASAPPTIAKPSVSPASGSVTSVVFSAADRPAEGPPPSDVMIKSAISVLSSAKRYALRDSTLVVRVLSGVRARRRQSLLLQGNDVFDTHRFSGSSRRASLEISEANYDAQRCDIPHYYFENPASSVTQMLKLAQIISNLPWSPPARSCERATSVFYA